MSLSQARPRHLFLGLGANLGDRALNLAAGLEFLELQGIRAVRQSPLYLTEPVGESRQPEFINQVVEVETDLPPATVLGAALGAEQALGRVRLVAGGARTLDVDLLLDGQRVLTEPGLRLPHPRLHLRRFVLVPLAGMAPDLRHPVLGVTMAELLQRCPDRSRVRSLASTTAL